jgi:hypothetical protein
MTEREKEFYELLWRHIGPAKAITQAEISRANGMKGSEVRRVVRFLRLQGIPVCSDHRGYWMAEQLEDHRAGTEHLFSRAMKLLKVYRVQKNIPAAELSGQVRLGLEGI